MVHRGGQRTFSQNRIENYVDALKDSPTYGKELGDMTIAYSPDVIANAFLNFHHRGFEAVFHTQHVGKQYFTNNENDALSLDAYCVTNLNLAYTSAPVRRAASAGPADQQPVQCGIREQRLRVFVHGHVERPRARTHRRGLLLPAGAAERAGERHGEILKRAISTPLKPNFSSEN